MKDRTKGWIERGLVGTRVGTLFRTLRRDQAVVLAYHNVVPDDQPPTGEVSLHLGFSEFRRQLDVLQATHRIVSLDDLLEQPHDPDRPAAALTFDDAYRGALELGLGEVVDRGVPATIFAAPGLVGAEAFWWDELGAGSDGRLEPELRRHALHELGGRHDAIRAWAREEVLGTGALPELMRPATEDEVVAAARRPGVAIGSHSWSHPNLTMLASGDLERELREARSWLAARLKEPSPWFAYPYGLCDTTARAAVDSVGHVGGLAGHLGWTRLPPSDRFAVPRVDVPAGVSEAGFRLRVSGLPVA